MYWLLSRWFRRALEDEESRADWYTMLKVQGVGLVLFLLLLGVGLMAQAEEQVSPEWQPNQELLRKLRED